MIGGMLLMCRWRRGSWGLSRGRASRCACQRLWSGIGGSASGGSVSRRVLTGVITRRCTAIDRSCMLHEWMKGSCMRGFWTHGTLKLPRKPNRSTFNDTTTIVCFTAEVLILIYNTCGPFMAERDSTLPLSQGQKSLRLNFPTPKESLP